ncbi:phosphoribosylglycinamide formyltransferase [Sulfitobacter sp. KE29]|uniref:phosphoribosylglycinamide formyltransferase n=1 Tax=unclassified Sulfitobacter TaxID=196795 RepID=UPI0007C3FFBA|nr:MULTISPECIES: phosphoribosylglycinamide formyltransferase [unclassified Sulfitobacter]KZY50696.1 phosphoribosylglycinamide formyltransferase [Sulfitobacter sp. HI0054]MDF3417223.1 phosphoribosylglycinamide formyltransferase [Sulfitobacter sp. Ks38]MDF3424705.1 phosphoribosylglycinamide formyltransferase [Sulfitobacter sp. KE29]MDF3428285.1 phosphoribosylglycinamide formyltransferase [Sulfitobacter sp. S46]MDF3443057.1 phosphoribosylglycinamide formyltransferase [Sulfitobacter sp. KE31]
MTKRVAIFVSGAGSNMRALVEDMTGDHAGRPCLVLSNNADAGGIAWAQGQGIATEVVDHRPFGKDRPAFEAALSAALEAHAPDIICLAGFMRKLTEGFTDAWAGRMINIHPSLLPKYRGLHTHARALEAGDTEHGCTVHEVTAALDDGPILGQARIPVLPGDTAESLAERVLVQEHRLYPAVLRRFAAGEREPVLLTG